MFKIRLSLLVLLLSAAGQFQRPMLNAVEPCVLKGVTLQRGAGFSGRISLEGFPASRAQSSMQVSLLPRNGGRAFGPAPSAITRPGGVFVFGNIFPGDYDIQIDNMEKGFYVRSARIGGDDILEHGFSTDAYPNGGRLEILIGRNGATIDGVVSKDHQPYTGATVVLVPDAPHRDETHLYRLIATDNSGRFVLEGVPPGDYKLFAWESVEHAAYTSSDFLRPFELRGESAHVSQGSHVTVNLELIPKEETE